MYSRLEQTENNVANTSHAHPWTPSRAANSARIVTRPPAIRVTRRLPILADSAVAKESKAMPAPMYRASAIGLMTGSEIDSGMAVISSVCTPKYREICVEIAQ